MALLFLDLKAVQSHDVSRLPWIGPLPGDIAEVEAYCRIFRQAERLHAALMETLCNPITGECRVSYDFPSEEKPLLEDKIVSVLGCILSLLNKGREEILSGRSNIMNSFRTADVSVMEDVLPPLAVFRSEMKRCSESLHVALENYLTPDDDRSLYVWRKLQRLKNVCYDSGFPRRESYPCHTLFANWDSVCLSTPKDNMASKDCEVAFCKGGQVTEEGLRWLIDKGFKTIVDIRSEAVKDNFYEAAIDDAILSGKIELVKIPVEVRTAPSVEQVGKFASLVSDCSKRPIYLHSKEGVWRASAMVSRWRQYMTRSGSLFVSNHPVSSNDIFSEKMHGTRGEAVHISKERLPLEEVKLQQTLDETRSSSGAFRKDSSVENDNKDLGISEIDNGSASTEGVKSVDETSNELGSVSKFYTEIDPLKAQSPPCNVFSKKEMSSFFKSKRICPPIYSNHQYKRLETLPAPRDPSIGAKGRSEMIGNNTAWGLMEITNSNWSPDGKEASKNPQNTTPGIGVSLNGNTYGFDGQNVNKLHEGQRNFAAETGVPSFSNNSDRELMSKSIRKGNNGNCTSSDSSDEDLGPVEANMCASATGVVRVQSRKKAEMFLVRTDGISCTREKVTESSLAFTHPSTQQQMLMWKSTPKTVLLLKKLGPELMEEAKEVWCRFFICSFKTILFAIVLNDYTMNSNDEETKMPFIT